MIRKTIEEHPEHEPYVLHSTGKDSVVTQHLCDLSGKQIKTVFNNTSLDCADTYKIVNRHRNDWIITNPDMGFYQYVKLYNFIPTRFSRGCCSIFKEGNHIKFFKDVEKAIWIAGVRNDESVKRKSRNDIWENPKWKNRNWFGIFPIRKWSELEVWLYILYNNLEVNPKYKKGYKRCGCHIACPYQSKTEWVLDEYFYPKMYERWHKIIEEYFIKNKKWCALNCTIEEFHKNWNGGVVHEVPTQEVIEEFMKYNNISDQSLAEQFFNKTCAKCGKNVKRKDVIGMNLKLRGTDIKDYYCKKCFMEKYGIDKQKWDEYVDTFKESSCVLF